MAILNATPDSFSDGGQAHGALLAKAHEAYTICQRDALLLIFDVGGQSTRPGATPVSPDEEQARVLPVIRALKTHYPDTRISIDTFDARVAEAALREGASVINDVSGLTHSKQAMARVAATASTPLILMHGFSDPESLTKAAQDKPTELSSITQRVIPFLQAQAQHAQQAGVAKQQIWLDPGFGFGKSVNDNLTLLRAIDELLALGHPLVIGTSRKSFLTLNSFAAANAIVAPAERDALTAASLAPVIQALYATQQAQPAMLHPTAGWADVCLWLRVHNVAAMAPVVTFLTAFYSNAPVLNQ